ncbi:Rieske [2Fe-2S] iron-sulfur domain-containing protein [Microdochium trichocladiopsis]|uniref:Choline monooxygenase, chloroplastic n=1 Tax=Microdochium trichocladiopsis TaxID=1682393 RepID=A0A9P8Y2Z5_9PEZI|nr:Rieske [2Fe-2S] iron-sulfur domain-containing protein [Microdochium trichocladiopsis]KAH7028773.1 Rieske [2Fe-2S] iron-sulfur domain-containing protein [Microdochium trichocladiopsis]
MAATMLHYLGFGSTANPTESQPTTTQSSVRSLPASWYTSQEMYELERRAIFSRRWLMMTHASRLKGPGDWLRYNVAGYDLVIIRDREGNINAFHNVCRHRAYPVVEKEGQGTAMILACRYHGWSYGLNGKLAKATGFKDIDNFDKENNGLLRIHTKTDRNGLIWINMDAQELPEVPWDEHFQDVDVQARYDPLNFDDYELDHTYELDGDYNWKILADNFNECYHCPTTHADIPTFLNLDSFDSQLKDGHIQHECVYTKEQLDRGLNVSSTYYFPNASMSVSPHFMMIQKFLPAGPKRSAMHYEIYRNKHSTDEDFKVISEMYARVMAEDKVLCANAQKNINTGVYVSGQLHPKFEKAPLFFQSTARQVVTEHFRREKKEGREVWAARQPLPADAAAVREDEEVCQGLACGSDKARLFDW